MQIRVSEYNQLKGQVNQQNRKATGSLAVRDLSGLVSSKDIISTENLVTLFVIVSKHNKLEWQSSYEKFCEFVVSHKPYQVCSTAKPSQLQCIHLLVVHLRMSRQLETILTSVQVPRSSKVVAEDNDNALFTVTLFRRVADTFKTAARTRGFQVTARIAASFCIWHVQIYNSSTQCPGPCIKPLVNLVQSSMHAALFILCIYMSCQLHQA